MSDNEFDVIVIGGGPGGYVCAIRCAQMGLATACIEGRGALGGTCLNVGCVPSKALLHATHLYHESRSNFRTMGLMGDPPSIDLAQMMTYKGNTISQNTAGIEFLFKKNKVTYIKGWGRMSGDGQVSVGETTYRAKNIVVATGSEPSSLPALPVDEKQIVTSTGALALETIPERLAVIGAGIIGLELGSVYSRLGSKVTVIEYLDEITPGLDTDICKAFRRTLSKQGLKFVLGAEVTGVTDAESHSTLTYVLKKSSSEKELDAEVVLVATGRRPFVGGLGFSECGGKLNDLGQIVTDANWRTSIEGVFAIGDVTAGPMLAHKAEDEGMAVADSIAGKAGHVNYDVIPGVIYTAPEVAFVGKTEDHLKDEGTAYRVGTFPFMGNARAKSMFMGEGFVKLLADAESDRILGCHVLGPSAGELIHEVCVAMEFGASAEDLALTCHAHPTCSEAVREAALACGLGAIHA